MLTKRGFEDTQTTTTGAKKGPAQLSLSVFQRLLLLMPLFLFGAGAANASILISITAPTEEVDGLYIMCNDGLPYYYATNGKVFTRTEMEHARYAKKTIDMGECSYGVVMKSGVHPTPYWIIGEDAAKALTIGFNFLYERGSTIKPNGGCNAWEPGPIIEKPRCFENAFDN